MNQDHYQLFLLPLLESLRDGEVHSSEYVQEELSKYVDYSDDTLKEFKGGSGNPVFLDSVTTAKEHLIRAGLIEHLTDGQCRITSLGKMVLSKRLNSLDEEFLRRMVGYGGEWM